MLRRLRTCVVRFGPVVAGLAVLAASSARPLADQAATQPSAAEIVARHVKAVGGAPAWKRVSSMKILGTFEMPGQGISGPVEIFAARPSSMLLRVNINGIGQIQSGYNGTHGWSIDPMAGPSLLSGGELQDTKDDAWFDSTLYEPDYVKSMETIAVEEFDKRPAHKVRMVLLSGREQFQYFEVESGLQIGNEGRRETAMGIVPAVSVLRDYKAFGGVMQPTVVIQRVLGIEQVVRIVSVEIDGVPASTFEPPAEIKALIKAPGR